MSEDERLPTWLLISDTSHSDNVIHAVRVGVECMNIRRPIGPNDNILYVWKSRNTELKHLDKHKSSVVLSFTHIPYLLKKVMVARERMKGCWLVDCWYCYMSLDIDNLVYIHLNKGDFIWWQWHPYELFTVMFFFFTQLDFQPARSVSTNLPLGNFGLSPHSQGLCAVGGETSGSSTRVWEMDYQSKQINTRENLKCKVFLISKVFFCLMEDLQVFPCLLWICGLNH